MKKNDVFDIKIRDLTYRESKFLVSLGDGVNIRQTSIGNILSNLAGLGLIFTFYTEEEVSRSNLAPKVKKCAIENIRIDRARAIVVLTKRGIAERCYYVMHPVKVKSWWEEGQEFFNNPDIKDYPTTFWQQYTDRSQPLPRYVFDGPEENSE